MQYTTLGKRTGLKVSRLGFGAMRLPMKGDKVDRDASTAMIHRAFELGVNYIDTAVFYCGGQSQPAVGEALKGWRDKVIVSTKNHAYNRADHATWRKNLEDSLRLLDVQCIDIYNLHGLAWDRFVKEVDGKGGSYTWMQKAKDEGLIKHICFSFHDKPDSLAKLARTGMFDVATCQYNLLDRANEQAMEVCRREGLGVVVMGPVGGGRLGAPNETLRNLLPGSKSVPETALRFVMTNPDVSVALSGMSTMRQVEENCRVASRRAPLSSAENRKVAAALTRYRKLAGLYCTGCNYCMPCPAGVDIPWMFTQLNNLKVFGLNEEAKKQYDHSTNRAVLCVACGKCLTNCPQGIDIISQLRQTVCRLDDAYGTLAVSLEPTRVEKWSSRGEKVKLSLAARLSAVNISDGEVSPHFGFAPDKGVTVRLGRTGKKLPPFGRLSLPVNIVAAGSGGEAIRTGLTAAGGPGKVVADGELRVLVAPPGGAKALAEAPAAELAPDEKAATTTPKSRAANGAKLAFAYDADALYFRATVRGPLAYPPSPEIQMPHADRVTIDFNLGRLAKAQGQRPPALTWRLMVSPPTVDGSCYQWLSNQWTGNHLWTEIKSRKVAGGVELTVRIPWKNIHCRPGRAGGALHAKLTWSAYDKAGKLAYQSQWADSGGWVVLA